MAISTRKMLRLQLFLSRSDAQTNSRVAGCTMYISVWLLKLIKSNSSIVQKKYAALGSWPRFRCLICELGSSAGFCCTSSQGSKSRSIARQSRASRWFLVFYRFAPRSLTADFSPQVPWLLPSAQVRVRAHLRHRHGQIDFGETSNWLTLIAWL